MLPMELQIYQIDSKKDKHCFAFEGYDTLKKITNKDKPIDRNIYKCVYTGLPEDTEEFKHFDLDDFYRFLNSPDKERPKEYKGHSLSVSDIIVVKNSPCIDDGAYFCDRFGWREISDEFLQAEKDLDANLFNKNIKGVLVRSGTAPEVCSIENELKALQNIVSGYIEVYEISDTAAIICNEEGKLKGLPFNCVVETTYSNEVFVGDIFIVGIDNETGEFVSLTEEEIDSYLEAFAKEEVLLDEPSICK